MKRCRPDALGDGRKADGFPGDMKWPRRAGLFGGLLAAVVSMVHAAGSQARPPDPLAALAPVPSLVEFAAAHRIPLQGITFAGESAGSRAGDSVTLLAAVQQGATQEQWLVGLTADNLTATEQALKPPAEAGIFTSTGLELRFVNSRTALEVYLAGPFTASAAENRSAPMETHARVLVSPEYLARGFGRFGQSALAIAARMRAAGLRQVAYATQGRPFSAADLKTGRDWAARVGLTPEEERWENEAYFAMISFFEMARSLPDFRALADPVLATPSLWSLGTHLGFSTRLVFHWPEVAARATPVAAEGYQFPLNVWFNDTLGTRAWLVVTPPRPPLQACAGIVAICAEHPTDPDRRLCLRLVAARPAQTKFENAR